MAMIRTPMITILFLPPRGGSGVIGPPATLRLRGKFTGGCPGVLPISGIVFIGGGGMGPALLIGVGASGLCPGWTGRQGPQSFG